MKIKAITLMAALTGVAGQAPANEGTAERNVTVCMEGHAHSDVAIRAQWPASRMFDGIGVTIDWRHGLRGCPSQGFMIQRARYEFARQDQGGCVAGRAGLQRFAQWL